MLENTSLILNFNQSEVVGEISVDSRIEALLLKGEQFVLSPTLAGPGSNGKMKIVSMTLIPIPAEER